MNVQGRVLVVTLCRAMMLVAWMGTMVLEAEEAARRPNVVFVLADDMRPDCVGALGHGVVKTPHLDGLVQEGTAFTRAVAAYPICHVSRAEILTGTTAFRNGVGYRGNVIDPGLKTWAGTLREAGYHTWYCGKWHNDGTPTKRGYEETRGLFSSGGGPKEQVPMADHAGRPATGYTGWTFKTNEGKPEPEKGVGLTPDTDRFIGDAAVAVIEGAAATTKGGEPKPFFLHVNFTSPHDPRIVPRGFEGLFLAANIPLPMNFLSVHPFDHGNADGRDEKILVKPLQEAELKAELAVYYACVSNMDAQVGRIVESLRKTGQLENTVIVFSSDQGLALGSHGLLGKQNLYEETFRVPLVFRGPGIVKGRRSEADCYLRDVFPTTCELARVPVPATVESRSLARLLHGGTEAVYPFVVGYFTNTQRGIRQGDWKLIEYPVIGKTQLFDLKSDAGEMRDLSGDTAQAERVKGMRGTLAGWRKENGDWGKDGGGASKE